MEAAIKHRLETGSIDKRLDALLEALDYGQEGISLVLDALYNSSREVRSTAYWLLEDREETNIQTHLNNYCPYILFECVNSILGEKWVEPDIFFISSNGKVIVTNRHRLGLGKGLGYQVRDLYTDDLLFENDRAYNYISISLKSNSIFISPYPVSQSKVIDLYTGNLINNVSNFLAPPILLSSDGKIISGDYSFEYIYIWNSHTGELINSLKWYRDNTASGYYNEHYLMCPDEKILLAVSGNVGIWQNSYRYFYSLWDLATNELITSAETVKNWIVDSILVTSNKQYLASGMRNGRLKVWNLTTDKMLYSFVGNAPSTLTGGGKHLICAEFNNILVYDLHSQNVICTLVGHKDKITHIVLSPDRQAIASYSIDGNIRIWSIPEET